MPALFLYLFPFFQSFFPPTYFTHTDQQCNFIYTKTWMWELSIISDSSFVLGCGFQGQSRQLEEKTFHGYLTHRQDTLVFHEVLSLPLSTVLHNEVKYLAIHDTLNLVSGGENNWPAQLEAGRNIELLSLQSKTATGKRPALILAKPNSHVQNRTVY